MKQLSRATETRILDANKSYQEAKRKLAAVSEAVSRAADELKSCNDGVQNAEQELINSWPFDVGDKVMYLNFTWTIIDKFIDSTNLLCKYKLGDPQLGSQIDDQNIKSALVEISYYEIQGKVIQHSQGD